MVHLRPVRIWIKSKFHDDLIIAHNGKIEERSLQLRRTLPPKPNAKLPVYCSKDRTTYQFQLYIEAKDELASRKSIKKVDLDQVGSWYSYYWWSYLEKL